MGEQLSYGDPGAVRDEPGQQPLDRVSERQSVLADELEHDDCDEGLRDAAHTEAIVSVKRYTSFQYGEPAGLLAT